MKPGGKLQRLLAGVVLAGLAGAPALRAADTMPDFDLARHGHPGKRLRAADLQGHIVVLDFFAYWCRPCKAASRALEKDIAAHYRAARGNPQGVPVTVVAVNVEAAHPEQTARFVAEVGAKLVAEDPEGKLLRHFSARALPYLVVVDATAGRRVLFQSAGLDRIEDLRTVIDGIGKERR